MWQRILTVLGDIKVSRYPLWMMYQPIDYKLAAKDAKLIRSRLIPGDLLLRGYDSYLDGYLIPGKYSHTGIYVGDGWIIHAVAEGVRRIEVEDYCRCDRLAILRPWRGQHAAIEYAISALGAQYDFAFSDGNNAYYCHELAALAYRAAGQEVYPYRPYPRLFPWAKPRYLADSFLNSYNFITVMEL